MLGKKKEKNFAVQEIERYEKRGFFMNYGKMAHKRFGFLINNRLNAFEELHDPLRKGDIPLNLGAYVSAMMLTTVIVGALSLIISIIIVPLFLGGFVSDIISPAKPPVSYTHLTLPTIYSV